MVYGSVVSHFIDFVVDQVLYLLRDGLLFGGENYQETPQFDGENTMASCRCSLPPSDYPLVN